MNEEITKAASAPITEKGKNKPFPTDTYNVGSPREERGACFYTRFSDGSITAERYNSTEMGPWIRPIPPESIPEDIPWGPIQREKAPTQTDTPVVGGTQGKTGE